MRGTKETHRGVPMRPVLLRRPKQVHFCTMVSANFDEVIFLIYLLFAQGKFKQSAFWSNYAQKCMFSAQKSTSWIWQITYILLVEAQKSGVV